MFTDDAGLRRKSVILSKRAYETVGAVEDLIFIARIGQPRGPAKSSRSIRRKLEELMDAPRSIANADADEIGESSRD